MPGAMSRPEFLVSGGGDDDGRCCLRTTEETSGNGNKNFLQLKHAGIPTRYQVQNESLRTGAGHKKE